MKIEIKGNDNDLLILDDEQLDNNNFIDVFIGDIEICVSLDELLSAVYTFDEKRIISILRENKYKE